MIRTIRFLEAASAQRFAKALSRPTEFQMQREYDSDDESESYGRYILPTVVQRRGCAVRTDAGESVIHEGMLRCHATGSVENDEPVRYKSPEQVYREQREALVTLDYASKGTGRTI